LIGALMMALFVASGSIVVPMLVHALIDLRSLVLIPVAVLRVHREEPAPIRSATRTS
jgi:membrane protease YdiL (CAAX protease family)